MDIEITPITPETTEARGARPYSYWVVNGDKTRPVDGGVIEESLLSVFVNGQELATIMCSPLDQEALALGFLYNEAVIDSLDEVRLVQANVARTSVDIFLDRSEFNPPRRLILTSGCGGGITLSDLTQQYPVLDTPYTTTPDVLARRMLDLKDAAHLYNKVRGVHTSILANEHQMLAVAEDVGRHNTIDKLTGKALIAGINTRDCLLLASGRISSEMLSKARRLGIPVIASRTAPTSTALSLAEEWNICVVGYLRRRGMRVYTHPWRLGLG